MRQIEENIDRFGHEEAMLKNGREPALARVFEKLKEARSGPTIIQTPPAYDPEANRVAEKAVQ
eukprot:10604413-Lingulodinium_polyedra.AAC.1